jgi:hypothetical protein
MGIIPTLSLPTNQHNIVKIQIWTYVIFRNDTHTLGAYHPGPYLPPSPATYIVKIKKQIESYVFFTFF